MTSFRVKPTVVDRGHAGRPRSAVPARPRVAHRAELGHDLDMLWVAARLSSEVTRALDAVRGVLWELETAA
jgi:hypothetical protein